MTSSLPRILLTGGAGFLGTAILKEFLSPDNILPFSELTVVDKREPKIKDERIRFINADICSYDDMMKAAEGKDIVIHSAAIVDWGSAPDGEIMRVNTGGTANIIKVCRDSNIKRLLYTSSLDAIFGGKPLVDIDETIPYPEKQPSTYCKSKQLAEKAVLEANSETLKTMVLRPCDIYGEGDPFHMGSLISMAKGGFYVRIGDCTAKSQHVYVGNMAHAHLMAAKAMLEDNPDVAGNVYFITDSQPSNFFTFFDRIVEGSGYKIWPKKFNIPKNIAFVMGSISEGIAFMGRPVKKYTPKFSRFAVTYTCSDFTFKTDKAFRHFGFTPKYTPEEAFKRTTEYFRK